MPTIRMTSTLEETVLFDLYLQEAPASVAALLESLPFELDLIHASVSGQEIWTDSTPDWAVPQENASVFTEPGELVIGPAGHPRNKTAGCLGIYYGEGKGLDAANIIGKVLEKDRPALRMIGERVWKNGSEKFRFELA